MMSCCCQAVACGRVIFGIDAAGLPKKRSPVWGLVEMYLANSSTLACSLPRTKHAMGLAVQDLITMPLYPEEINKRTSSLHFFLRNREARCQRLPPRTGIQTYGHNKEIVVIQIDHNNAFRGATPKSNEAPSYDYDSRHILRAGLPYATIGVFHVHPSITHGAARDGFQNGIMPLVTTVTTHQCDAITGDANKSANTYSRLQSVYNSESRLINHIMQKYQATWNGTMEMPVEDRLDYCYLLYNEGHCSTPLIHEDRLRSGSNLSRLHDDFRIWMGKDRRPTPIPKFRD